MVLSDADILRALRDGELELAPFDERNLTPNGYDLTVDAVLIPSSGEEVRSGLARVPALSWFVVSTRERVRLGRGLAAQLWLRSGYARRGVLASFGKVDAGFAGNLTVSAFNASPGELELPVGERFCQLVVERLDSPALKDYPERSGRFQNQSGVTLAPLGDGGVARGAVQRVGGERISRGEGGAQDLLNDGSVCLRHRCHLCCEGTEMPLTRDDLSRIRSLGFRESDFCVEEGGWSRLRNVDGRCFFLKDGLCSIYPSRPEGCRIYPLVYDESTGEAAMDPECPHTAEFGGIEEGGKDVIALARRLLRERRERRS